MNKVKIGINGFGRIGRQAFKIALEKAEAEVLNSYLPKARSAEEVAALVKEAIAEAGATSKAQMGAVMKALGPKVGGRADGKTLSAEVQRQLSG